MRIQKPDPAHVLGCRIDRLTMAQTLDVCAEAVEQRRFTQHMAINAAKIVAMHDDPKLREIIAACELVNADGQSVVWASRLVGDPLPERVAGIDLMHELLKLAASRGYRVYILGARQEVLEEAVRRLRAKHPDLVLAGYRHGYFSDEEEADVAREIGATNPDILFVAMSSPRKEYFLGTYRDVLGAPFVMGVGGSIDVVAGATRRAPRLMQRVGLEWLFRLLQEPRRMFRRYAVTNGRFIALVAAAVVRRRLSALEPGKEVGTVMALPGALL
jgi:N-acetylglucosaminyldiphosphoundecaprenol N-acetyl-beta-D-mannosaminyltransferase